jgi:hypothetical protein
MDQPPDDAANAFGVDDDVFRDVNEIRIIKRALGAALALDDHERADFVAQVDRYVNVISRALRRGSLLLCYEMINAVELGLPIPDLFNQTDTYWKKILMREPDDVLPPVTRELQVQVDPTDQVRPIRVCALARRPDIGRLVFPDADAGGSNTRVDKLPPGFDQVLAYAAISFRTTVLNCAWVHLFCRLSRLTRAWVHTWTARFGVVCPTAHDIMTAIRRPSVPLTLVQVMTAAEWPSDVQTFVTTVRERLGAKNDVPLFDDHGKSMPFAALFRFNYWMQQGFRTCRVRLAHLMPIFRVRRAHVRLDCKSLLAILVPLFPKDTAVLSLLKARAAQAALEYAATKARGKGKGKSATDHGHTDPDHFMMNHLTRPARLTKAKCESDAAWTEYKAKVEADREARLAIKATDAYKAQRAKYEDFVALEVKVVRTFFDFKGIGNTGSGAASAAGKRRWTFDGSIVTDGVSVSLQFSRQVTRKVGGSKEQKSVKRREAALPANAKAASKLKRRARSSMPVATVDYDRDQATHLEDRNLLVLGLDPGRVHLATLAYQRNGDASTGRSAEDDVWQLKRTQYRKKSLINMLESLKRHRFSALLKEWSGLGDVDSALTTHRARDVLEYMVRYEAVQDRWWELALQRRESRSEFQGYIGKRKVLDGFFGGIQRAVRKQFPGTDVVVAYGSAGPKMKATGRGEQAVPTTGTYRACKRVFGAQATVLTDEFRTTCVDWESGKRNHTVYAVPDGRGGFVRESTAKKSAPAAAEEHKEAVASWRQVRRRENERLSPQGEVLYPVIRGLRFCPETRKYHNRDGSSALTIGRLHCLRVLGQPRPEPFSRSYRLS